MIEADFKKAILYGFSHYWKHKVFLLSLLVFSFICVIPLSFMHLLVEKTGYFKNSLPLLFISLIVALFFCQLYFSFYKIVLDMMEKRKTSVLQIFYGFSLVIPIMALASLFFGVLLFSLAPLGALFMAIKKVEVISPFTYKIFLTLTALAYFAIVVYFIGRFYFAPLIMVERHAGPLEALKKSYGMTEKKAYQGAALFLFFLLSLVVAGLLVRLCVASIGNILPIRLYNPWRMSINILVYSASLSIPFITTAFMYKKLRN